MKNNLLIIAICALCTRAYSQWSLTGNTGTNASTNFIGTKDNVAFKIRTNNNVRMTVTSSGKVGIGTSNPQSKLDVAGSITGYDSYLGRNYPVSAGTSGASYCSVGYGLTFSDTTANYRYRINNDYSSMISFRSGGFDFNTAPIGTKGNVIPFTTVMAILQNGNVGIGTLTPAYKLSVAGTANFTTVRTGFLYAAAGVPGNAIVNIENNNGTFNSDGLYITAGSNTTNGAWFISFDRPDGTQIGHIEQTSANGVFLFTSSDKRLKNIVGESQKGLSDLMKIKIYDYTFKSDPNKKVITGFMAQELYDVFPQSVSKPRDNNEPAEKNPWMVDYGSVTPLIIKSVQEQQTEIEELKSDVKSQKSEIETLRAEALAQKSEIENLKSCIELLCNNVERQNSVSEKQTSALLFQNIPNPFSEQTIIRFTIPTSAKSALIEISDSGNKKVKSFLISERGSSQINLPAGSLVAGVYTYQLIIDGKVVDSKKMMLTR